AKSTWKYIGFSHQSVPSLSKVAMRSDTGTKSGPPSLVTRATKSTMACLAGQSFQDGSGSSAAAHWAATSNSPSTTKQQGLARIKSSFKWNYFAESFDAGCCLSAF